MLRLPSKEKVRDRVPFSGRDYRYLALKSFYFLFFIEQNLKKSRMLFKFQELGMYKGPFTQAIFVAATRCNFCRAKVATSKMHV